MIIFSGKATCLLFPVDIRRYFSPTFIVVVVDGMCLPKFAYISGHRK